jgi:hypothetical protein
MDPGVRQDDSWNNDVQTKMAGISPGHFIWQLPRLTSAVRCRVAAAAAMPFRR